MHMRVRYVLPLISICVGRVPHLPAHCCRFRETSGFGAILADEMGLGKTLQTLTLIWTLLRQGVCFLLVPNAACSSFGGVLCVFRRFLSFVNLPNSWLTR